MPNRLAKQLLRLRLEAEPASDGHRLRAAIWAARARLREGGSCNPETLDDRSDGR